MPFDQYIAIGDSMSIDCYPAMDAGLPATAPVGAAALLYRNNDELWPEFHGKDLATIFPGIKFSNLCVDGATTWDFADSNISDFVPDANHEGTLITLTIGGNDALQLLHIPPSDSSKLVAEVNAIETRLNSLFTRLATEYSKATIILNSIYDPSDGTGNLGSYANFSDKLPFLQYLNHQIQAAATKHNFLFADVHKAFLGHGVTSKDRMYYWPASPIEPSALGASILRKLWLETLNLF